MSDPESDLTRHEGRWLRFRERFFINASGEPRTWEFVSRKDTPGAVAVIATTRDTPPRIVVVRQFRPPLGSWILEFPAGLMEAGHSAGETALRELAEETGCIGELRSVGPAVYESPGVTDASVALVYAEVVGRGEPSREADEQLEVVELPLDGLLDALCQAEADGTRVDAKLWCFAVGLNFQ